MVDKKSEEYIIRSVRIPERVWGLIRKLANKGYRPINGQMIKILEDWLVDHEYMNDQDRSSSE